MINLGLDFHGWKSISNLCLLMNGKSRLQGQEGWSPTYKLRGQWYGELTISMVECEGLVLVTLAIIKKWSRELRGGNKGCDIMQLRKFVASWLVSGCLPHHKDTLVKLKPRQQQYAKHLQNWHEADLECYKDALKEMGEENKKQRSRKWKSVAPSSITKFFGYQTLHQKTNAPQLKFLEELVLFVAKGYVVLSIVDNNQLKESQGWFPSRKQMSQELILEMFARTMQCFVLPALGVCALFILLVTCGQATHGSTL